MRMIGVDEALEIVLREVARRGVTPAEPIALSEAAGRVLRETVRADRDLPPFTRSAMDGYAVRAADTASCPVELEVVEEIAAGSVPRRGLAPGQASRIMTGAPLPEGADSVQMVEQTVALGAGRVRIAQPVQPGQHVRRAGEDLRAGEVLVEAAIRIGPADIGLLAGAGRARLQAGRRPRAAILPTGDELVGIDEEPGPSRIRESNGRTLAALAALAGADATLHPVARDSRDDLKHRIGVALAETDVLLLSGGVSMGDYDLVGAVLKEMGCRSKFERVAIQPGKPLFFGSMDDRLVFGLPGNPVSTVVDFLVFARPALRALAGESSPIDPTLPARLDAPLRRTAGRRAYLPAALTAGPSGAIGLRLIPSRGSADMVALARAEALAILPEEPGELPAGFMARALPLAGLTRG